MKRNRLDQQGFHIAELFMVLIVLGIIGLVGFKVLTKKDQVKPISVNDGSSQKAKDEETDTDKSSNTHIVWMLTQNGWMAQSQPPKCPEPLNMPAPTDLTKVTSILYPGQTRGGNYKPHGGFRFDTIKDNKVVVTAPAAAEVVRGSRYLVNGEVQYTFDMIMACGYMLRVGHLRVLDPKFQAVADTFSAAKEGDSHTENLQQPYDVKKGDVIATSVGITADKNTFFDFGVYDLRSQNEVSKTPAYQAAHPNGKELEWHAVCWFDLLSAKDNATVRALPAGDPTSGKTSDYCK